MDAAINSEDGLLIRCDIWPRSSERSKDIENAIISEKIQWVHTLSRIHFKHRNVSLKAKSIFKDIFYNSFNFFIFGTIYARFLYIVSLKNKRVIIVSQKSKKPTYYQIKIHGFKKIYNSLYIIRCAL
jgi:hypothetical protein